MANSSSLFELERLAINFALSANWEEAIRVNQDILQIEPFNIAALNRLGISYLKSNQIDLAKKEFEQVLKIDQFNTIAKNNLRRSVSKFASSIQQDSPLSNHTFSFIEEPGKSKVITLTNIGEPQVLTNVYTGLEVQLTISARRVKVETSQEKYIGSLPDDISVHLIRLIKAGYKYRTLIKTSDLNHVEVFIQEIKSSKKLRGILSFNSSHLLDDLDISAGSINQPPLEIYDQEIEEI